MPVGAICLRRDMPLRGREGIHIISCWTTSMKSKSCSGNSTSTPNDTERPLIYCPPVLRIWRANPGGALRRLFRGVEGRGKGNSLHTASSDNVVQVTLPAAAWGSHSRAHDVVAIAKCAIMALSWFLYNRRVPARVVLVVIHCVRSRTRKEVIS